MAGHDTEYEQNEGDIITNLHINNIGKLEVTYKYYNKWQITDYNSFCDHTTSYI